jgi:hypothetical protein
LATSLGEQQRVRDDTAAGSEAKRHGWS